jgi:hypothetical protein
MYKDPIDDWMTDDEESNLLPLIHTKSGCTDEMNQSDGESTLLDEDSIHEPFSHLTFQSFTSDSLPPVTKHISNISHSSSLASTLLSFESPFIPNIAFMTEHALIREVLFMLHGHSTNVFKFTDDGNVMVSNDVSMHHASKLATMGLLSAFAGIGETAQRLRMLESGCVFICNSALKTILTVASIFRQLKSSVHEALAHAHKATLQDFEKEVASLTEFYTSNIHDVEFGQHASLLQLRDRLEQSFERLKITDGFSGLLAHGMHFLLNCDTIFILISGT